jgi:hypothetical protein
MATIRERLKRRANWKTSTLLAIVCFFIAGTIGANSMVRVPWMAYVVWLGVIMPAALAATAPLLPSTRCPKCERRLKATDRALPACPSCGVSFDAEMSH